MKRQPPAQREDVKESVTSHAVKGKTLSDTTTSDSITCPCGKIVSGNGGRSSHQRTCAVYHQDKIIRQERNVAAWRQDTASTHAHDIRNAERLIAGHREALASILARGDTSLTAAQLAVLARVAGVDG